MKKKRILNTLFICTLLPFFAQNAANPQNGQKTTVQTVKVEETVEYDTAYYGARVEPVNSSTLLVPFGGTIRQVFVKEGDRVTKDSPLYDIIRTTQGSTGDYAPLTVRALISGIISAVTIHPGDEVRDGTSTMMVADISGLKTVISVSDKDVSQMRKNMQCNVKDLSDARGTISKISVLPDSKTGLFSVEVLFNKSAALFPGKFVTLLVPVNPVRGTFIPTVAIVSRYSKKFVWVIDAQNKASMAEIQLINMKGDVSLVTGLKSGQLIAVSNTRLLTPGAEVNPVAARTGQQPRRPF